MNKKLLFVMSRPPHGANYLQEILDVMMTAAAFDQEVRVLFLDDGVYQLKKGQDPGATNTKNITPIFQALSIYDIKDYFVEDESIKERALDLDDLELLVELVPRNQIGSLMLAHDTVYNS